MAWAGSQADGRERTGAAACVKDASTPGNG